MGRVCGGFWDGESVGVDVECKVGGVRKGGGAALVNFGASAGSEHRRSENV